MARYSKGTWQQLQKLTKKNMIRALERDGWNRQTRKGAQGRKGSNTLAFIHDDRPVDKNRIVIHYHDSKEQMGQKLLTQQLELTGWTEEDLKRLKIIK